PGTPAGTGPPGPRPGRNTAAPRSRSGRCSQSPPARRHPGPPPGPPAAAPAWRSFCALHPGCQPLAHHHGGAPARRGADHQPVHK
ncbi:hypothetical protein BFDFBN_BFDFBN_16610, partial [Dysosmobacter welbionis]